MKFTEDGKAITISLSTFKKILIGYRESFVRIIHIVNSQEITVSDKEYFDGLKNPSKQWEFLDMETDEVCGEPICSEPLVTLAFGRFLSGKDDG